MRVLIAPDKFAGTLTAPQAAAAIADGWHRTAPDDQVTLVPMADGGPGFVDVLHSTLGGRLDAVTVSGPTGEPVPLTVLTVGDTAYLESAQACGLHLTGGSGAMTATSRGVGEAVVAAIGGGATRIVVGLGGSGTNDGGAGLLAALGATSDVPLDSGPTGLRGISSIDLDPAREKVRGVELIAAADVDVSLLGMFGASKTFGPQKGLDDSEIIEADGQLDRLVEAICGPTPAERRIAEAKGAGAAGGLGFAMLVLGAEITSGVGVVADALGLRSQIAAHDLVITGEGAFDYSSRAGKVVHGVAQDAMAAARPCIVLAGRVDVGSREMRALGIESAYGITDRVGETEAMARPAEHLADLAQRVARSWSQG